MDFVVDEFLLMETKKKCEDKAKEIEEYITAIYTGIADLNNYWEGDSYNEFSSTCDQYRDSLDQLVNLINAFAFLIGKVDEPRSNLESSIKSALGE